MPVSISAVVISYNQAHKIGRTLAALRTLTEDVIVIDSLSTDDTTAVAQAHGARVIEQAWLGYSAQKNLGNAHAKHNWIISIDDDEVVSEELVQSIKKAFETTPACDAFELPFRTIFCGQLIKYGGWNPESHVRIFDKQKISWNTDAVHEGLTLQPHHRVQRLRGYVYHYTVDTLEQFYEKTERYSRLFAEKAAKMGKKASWTKQYFSPLVRFVREYFLKLGFLDGRYGFIIAKENARYTYLKYRKIE
jgi:glycosyltransferase involved in cell wall biosynthesis